MTDSWEELNLVSASPKLLHKGIEGVVMKQIAAATKRGTHLKMKTRFCHINNATMQKMFVFFFMWPFYTPVDLVLVTTCICV